MNEIFNTLAITGLAMAALTYISREIVLHIFSRDLAAQKSKLDQELQRHAHDLNCFLQQFQIQFSRTYELQVDAIRQLYDAMRQLLSKIENVASLIRLDDVFKTSHPPIIARAIDEASSAHRALSKLYDDNDIYLPSALSDRMATFLDATSKPSSNRHTLFPESFTKEMIAEWDSVWSDTQPNVQQLLSDLKTEFRRLQGVDTVGQQPASEGDK